MPAVPSYHEPQHAMTTRGGKKKQQKNNRKFSPKNQADSAVIKNEDR